MSSEPELPLMTFNEERCTSPKGLRFAMAKHDDVLGVEGDDKFIAVAPKCHQPFRTFDAGGQLNLSDLPLGATLVLPAMTSRRRQQL